MVNGSSIAIFMGEAMLAEAKRMRVPVDITDDLADAIDKLLATVVRSKGDAAGRAGIRQQVGIIVEVFGIGMGCAWELQVKEYRGNDNAN